MDAGRGIADRGTGVDDDDDPEELPCYRHAGRLTALRCLQCERPICVDCAMQAAVGIKCPECGRMSRAARGAVPVARLLRGLGVGGVVALLAGSILAVVHVPFLGIILAWAAGAAVGAVVRAASGGFRDPLLARGAALLALFGMLGPPVLLSLAAGSLASWASGPGMVWDIVGAAIAAWAAFTRASS